MGVLLFQDLAVVPLLVLIPALKSPPEELLAAMGWALVKATALLTVLLVGGQKVMRWWLTLVARRKSEDMPPRLPPPPLLGDTKVFAV